MPDDVEPFYNRVLSVEGDIFKACTTLWPPLKKIILQELSSAASALEGQVATKIFEETILEVAEAVATAEREGVQVDWIDREIVIILKAKDHHRLAQATDQERERIEIVQ